ncbi:hypothetical protein PVK06_007321 [Gossypium arboreum]|uniref:Bet v I/Major latex protein domain-containing protein n=1 Tax=Gossypium arboreum TaxID=29729 RepID=A0ABR0QH78_GOSAR|nr:hypothetical protein PVK06_007321 [Gossypium arboreum]
MTGGRSEERATWTRARVDVGVAGWGWGLLLECTLGKNVVCLDEKAKKVKEVVEAVEHDKNLVTFRVIEGDLMEEYELCSHDSSFA